VQKRTSVTWLAIMEEFYNAKKACCNSRYNFKIKVSCSLLQMAIQYNIMIQ